MKLKCSQTKKFTVTKFTVEKVYKMSVFILYSQSQLQESKEFAMKPFFFRNE